MINYPKNIKKYLLSEISAHYNIRKNSILRKIPFACNSNAYNLNNEYIIKLPRPNHYSQDLYKIQKEVVIQNYLKNKITLNIPCSKLLGTEYIFSIQKKIPGRNITSYIYNKLTNNEKNNMAKYLTKFICELQSMPLKQVIKFNLPYWNRYKRVFPSMNVILDTLDKDKNTFKLRPFLIDFTKHYFNKCKTEKLVFGHFDILGKNILFDIKTKKINGICDFSDCGIGHYEYEFSNIDFGGRDLLKRIKKYYKPKDKNLKLNIQKILDHTLFARLSFYINYLNGIEKVQTDCLKKLKAEIKMQKIKIG